ncbi:MAG: hypothetical protein ACM3SR_07245 [Ignavibacteriales bacterium]
MERTLGQSPDRRRRGPRQGWLSSFDGVFYRLGILTGTLAQDFNENGNQYNGGLSLYAPFNQRFELLFNIPFIVSNREPSGSDYKTNFGDVQITTRFLISESRNFTQSFNVAFRIPSGSDVNGNGFAAVTPDWEFWWNIWCKLVLRGGVGFAIPYTDTDRTRDAILGNLAIGYYFTPHDFIPLGDLVWYVAANVNQPVDNGSKEPGVTLTPGFRTHLGRNWYLLGGIELPVTDPVPFNFQVLAGLMKVF